MKRNVKITLQYDGGRYKGWQKLGDNPNTIQQKLEDILEKKVGRNIPVIGSGRTDAGVHALGQVANFHLVTDETASQIQDYINAYLPGDIAVTEAIFVPEAFHSRYHVKEKIYSYRIHNDAIPFVFDRKYCHHVPEPLRLEPMREAMAMLEGTHDFLGFSSLKKTKKSTTRTLHSLTLEKEGPKLRFIFQGDGFLLHSIRIMMGTLLEVGFGTMKPKEIEEIFIKKVRREAGFTVPPQGLFLEEVRY
ncbi:tRNA pseudouridine(38-40) synthase TruA [Alkalibacter rhizosphaerae]|uniref:tRNA pseudouridine synthase A n=1 Tax=Alkalibacter rhizosphaerae TaxID=2815577 RepID=A0A974XIJ8_9FIRM|nr:tRNA pseudouridine(38-40) synthase TruA [Alkalibacter rhizosphaerae]QSX09350.1 tRNA pseudouridine(38-40) synthase TruA [Alkalibacter rhizosphaerae]